MKIDFLASFVILFLFFPLGLQESLPGYRKNGPRCERRGCNCPKKFLKTSNREKEAEGSPLRCYTCLFPTISPLDCLKFATPCGPSQKCLTSVAKGHRGALELVIHEKTCGDPSMCGIRGIRNILGINFTYSTFCCSTDLCNGVAGEFSTFWKLLVFTPFLFILVYLC